MAQRASRKTARKNLNMAVRPKPRPTASRTQIGVVVLVAIVGTLGLALLASPSAQGSSALIPSAPPAVNAIRAAPTQAIATVVAPVPLVAFATSTPDARPPGPYVGIVAGHWGNDSGAECPDGVTEQQVNLEIAKRVTEKLRAKGVWVDLLQEFDDRLKGYRADVLLSIHADSCQPIDADPPATGFKVARSVASAIPNTEDKLVNCIKTEYQRATNMHFHENSITRDMTSYHSFSEIDPDTPAAIIETGFLYLDYNMLVKQPDRPAQGIANGILCFLNSP